MITIFSLVHPVYQHDVVSVCQTDLVLLDISVSSVSRFKYD